MALKSEVGDTVFNATGIIGHSETRNLNILRHHQFILSATSALLLSEPKNGTHKNFALQNCNTCKQGSENCPVILLNRSSQYVIKSSSNDYSNPEWNSWHLYQSLCLHFWCVKVLWHSNVWKQCQMEWLTSWFSAFKVVLKHFVDKYLTFWEHKIFCAFRFFRSPSKWTKKTKRTIELTFTSQISMYFELI